jgi:Ran GTPase-activating protein (RanGAP) involved in mRNA processing and transport
MLALIDSFIHNADSLKEVHIHDNWIKNEAVDKLVDFLLRAKTLQKLNISDSDMGSDAVFRVVKALKES